MRLFNTYPNAFMKCTSWHTILLIGCLFLSACHGAKNEITVVNRNFETEVEQQQNLTFTFNKDIYPDSLLQQWDSTAYIEFNPAVKGMFKWNSSSELMFSPNNGFRPGTNYTAKITSRILKLCRKKYWLGNKNDYQFHTAPLRVERTHLSWTRGKNMANVMVQLDIDFNYDVKVDEAVQRLKLSSGNTNVSISSVNNGTGKTVSVQFMPLNDLDQETPLKIDIAKGISVVPGTYISEKDTSVNAIIPSRYNLSVTGMMAEHTGTEGVITVNTSQPINEEGLKNYITIEPAVPFDVSVSDAGFVITSSSLKADQTYELTISDKLEGAFGGKLKRNYSEQVTFGKLKPTINFINSKGMYLSSQGYKNLALNIVNVPKLEVTVVKVYENNLEGFMRKGTRYGYGSDDEEDEGDDDGGGYEYYNTEDIGDTIFHQGYETGKLPKQNSARVLHLDFKDKIRDYNGVYVITVASKDHRWLQQSKILSVSDIGLIVKEEKDNMYVFANSIHNATPLSGVKVSFYSTNNQKLYSANTDADGVAVFNGIAKQAPGFKIGMVTAKKDDEFSFVWLSQSRVETSRFDVDGRMPNDVGLNAMIYAERNLYRPGETIHVSTVVRDEQWGMPGEVPVKLRLMMPNGKEFATMRKILNDEGSCETSFNMPASTLTGTYILQVLTGNDVLLNSYNISVEEFMPDRMKVSLKLDKKEYKVGDSVLANLQADNLFGTPAAGRNYECELNLDKGIFAAKNYPDFNFRVENDLNFQTIVRNGKTDEKGATQVPIALDNIGDAGMLNGNVMATVFDETGRPVHRYEHFTVYTHPIFTGIKVADEYVGTRKPMKIGLIAVDKNGVAQNNVEEDISIVKKEWHTVIQQDGNRYKYVSQKDEKIVYHTKMRVSGANTSFYYTADLSGEYEVRVSVAGSDSYVESDFYAWGWGDTQYTSFEVNNEGNVDIKADKDKYALNDKVNLLFTTPFEGRMLVTVERDKVIKYYYLNTTNKTASLNMVASEVCVPNVYITATLFRPMDGSDMPLTVAHGFKSITVENQQDHIPVSIAVAEKSRSKTKQTITVKTVPDAYVTIAAVDEGILQVKNYISPDPYAYFYQKEGLSVNSYDIYPLLLPEIKTMRSSTGGDMSVESELRVNPMFVNRVKLVSFWSSILQADARGIVKYSIDVPQFSGDIRVMAVAYKGKQFGSGEKHMKVADPIVISTALPRFMSPKDEVEMPVSLSNTTGKDANATVSVQLSGPLSMSGTTMQTVKIPANREGRVVFNITAQAAIGACKVNVVVKALGETFSDETEIAVRPAASLQKITGNGVATENKSTQVNMNYNFLPNTLHGKLIVGRSPLIQFTKNISDLVQYPYGCVEQTTSAAFPQLYYHDLVKSIYGREDHDMNPSYNVQKAILKLQSMQMPDGALSYWPGGGYESWWGSVYATHFLLEARKAGYEVNEHTIDRLLDYMRSQLERKETEIYYINGGTRLDVAAQEIPYSLYVLALAGQPQRSFMNYYKGNLSVLTPDGKYMLAAAFALSGQTLQARQVLPSTFGNEKADPSFGGSFYSYIRDESLALNALLDIDANNPQVGILARQVSEQMKNSPYLNTQENVFGLLALGKIARATNNTTATATVIVNGKTIAASKGDNLNIDLRSYVNQPVNVTVHGKGPYYYFWETSGITRDGSFKQEDKFIKVRRSYFDRNGKEISSNVFHQNDLVVVRVSIEAQYNGEIPNVAITDMLPAGFEIENTRLTEMPEMKWIKDEAEPDYMDVRDDRANFFATVTGDRKDFYYMVRAVSPGTYQVGPVQADAMYNGAYHSYNGAGVVKVLDK